MKISKTFRFEASHQLPKHPGKCARLHGHSWVLTVSVQGPLNDESSMVMDFVDLKAVVQPIIDRLDHQHLGNGSVLVHYGRLDCTEVERTVHLPSTVGGLQLENPTSEALILWIASELPRNFPWYDMTLNETCTSACTLHREEYEYGYNQKASNAQASATRPQAPEAALDQDSYKEARVTHHVTEARVTAFKDTVEGMA